MRLIAKETEKDCMLQVIIVLMGELGSANSEINGVVEIFDNLHIKNKLLQGISFK